MEKCSIPMCNRKAKAHRMCETHVKRWRRGLRGTKLYAPIRGYSKEESGHESRHNSPIESGYDECWDRFQQFIGMRSERKASIPPERGGAVTWGVISDLHVPFHNERAFIESVEWLKDNGATRLVIGGDFLDCYSLSRFAQYKPVPIQHEVREARKLVDHCSRTFAEVRVIEGNHEARERKHLSGKLPPDLLNWFLAEGMLRRVTSDMPNIEVVSMKVHETEMGWLMQVGEDCIVGHPETSSRVPLKPVENFRLWLSEWHEAIGLRRPRLVVIGHTHQAGMAWVGPTMIVENGCLCRIQGYALEPRLYSKPQRLACTIFTQVDGRTDLNSVRQFYPELKCGIRSLAA